MLSEIITALQSKLNTIFTEVELYEGQFDKLDEVVVQPPWAYIKLVGTDGADTNKLFDKLNLLLYVISSSVGNHQSAMLGLIESVFTELNRKGLRDTHGNFLGTVIMGNFRDEATYPGLVVFGVELTLES